MPFMSLPVDLRAIAVVAPQAGAIRSAAHQHPRQM
jgi:hypothetical protein